MGERQRIDPGALVLPEELAAWVGHAPLYDCSGESGARTLYVDRDGGAYLKIAAPGSLGTAARMQAYLAERGMSSPVLRYLPSERDYLLTAPVRGEDGTTERYLAEPERLSEVFGRSLRRLHQVDTAGCPVQDAMSGLARMAAAASFRQDHLDDIAGYIGAARADAAAEEIAAGIGLLKNDVLIHGDCCLPNIMLHDWAFAGFVDVAGAGVGDRHYDLVWGLWTLCWNLKSPRYGRRFLDAYGSERIDGDRLRLCGLLAAMD